MFTGAGEGGESSGATFTVLISIVVYSVECVSPPSGIMGVRGVVVITTCAADIV